MWPKVSILIPTLNAQNVLEQCLNAISTQEYPKEQIEIIIADGGSTDSTLDIATKHGAKVVPNKLKTAEAGKMAALREATGEFIALIDSDNWLPHNKWLQNMISPLLKHPKAIGSEPWEYTWRPQDGFITRYCALIGMNDPLVHFLGNYDRVNLLTGKWTETPHEEQDMGAYLLVKLDQRGIPTIGANGTVFRTDVIKANAPGDYLFDIDVIASVLDKQQTLEFIKVKDGIIHSFCESNISKFARKQGRRISDFLFHKNLGTRTYPWNKLNYFGFLKFGSYCVTVLPLIAQSIKGYLRKKDPAWFFHILACEITLWEYGKGVIKNLFVKQEFDRSKWSQ